MSEREGLGPAPTPPCDLGDCDQPSTGVIYRPQHQDHIDAVQLCAEHRVAYDDHDQDTRVAVFMAVYNRYPTTA
jgi:hypothetical protein